MKIDKRKTEDLLKRVEACLQKYHVAANPREEVAQILTSVLSEEKTPIEEELIFKYFRVPKNDTDKGAVKRTATDINQRLLTLAPRLRVNPQHVGAALKKAGFKRVSARINGNSVKCYLVIEVLPGDELEESFPDKAQPDIL